MNQKILLYTSIVGIIGTLSLFIYSLFIITEYRILLLVSITAFTYLFCLSQKANSSQTESLVASVLVLSFMLINFTDFYFEYHYSKNDWKATKGFIDQIDNRTSKHSPGNIYYHFYDGNQKYESTKQTSLLLNFGFKESDSIYVVYSKSFPLVNDIYQLKNGPNLHDRENFILYFIKNNSLFKWSIILISIYLLFKFLFNRKK